jgi:hypothetical protein
MSVDYTTYVGPYLECKVETAQKPHKISSCTNEKCKEYERELWNRKKFCDNCGTQIGEITIMRTESKVSQMEVQEEIEEDLYCVNRLAEEDIWMANKGRQDKNARRFHLDHTEGAEEITHDMMVAETAEFIDQYRHALSVVRKRYNPENVYIKWGIVNSTH